VPRPGAWLRLTALFASGAVLLAVVSGAASLGAAHRVLAALALPPLVALVVAAWIAHRRLLVPALGALVLFGIAALVTLPGLHLALAAVAFAATLVLTVATYRGEPVPRAAWRDYVTLTKPRIMSLLLVTGLCAMFVGAGGVPAAWLVVVTMTGLALACGGASALNHVLDADIDKLMGKRTRARPLAAERMPPTRALEFGLTLSAFSFVLLASLVNVLTATLALVGNLFYVLVYTRWLKRSTPQNIVIGGAAGAVPPLVGWAAVTGNLTLPALWLFLIVFFWTPPHFWALALLIRRDCCAVPVGDARRRLPGRRARARRRVPLARAAAPPRRDPPPRRAAVPLLVALPGAALRRDGPRPGARMSEPLPPRTTIEPVEATTEIARRNVVMGWALLGLSLLIAAGAVGVSLIYLHFD
jgi:protoheme IX farnesyltransferase